MKPTSQTGKYCPEGAFLSASRLDMVKTLTVDQVEELRRRLRIVPDDLELRFILMSYDRGSTTTRRANPDAFHRSMNWLIEHHPRHVYHSQPLVTKYGELYELGCDLWRQHVKCSPCDVTILFHGALHLESHSDREAEQWLLRAQELDEEYEEVSRELSMLYRNMAALETDSDLETEYARKSLQHMREAIRRYALSDDLDSYLMPCFDMQITETAKFALFYELIDEVAALAQIMIDRQTIEAKRFSSRQPHHDVSALRAHTILGLAALASGDLEEARRNAEIRRTCRYGDWVYDFYLHHELERAS